MGERVWYCTREDVKGALDSATTARNNTRVDRAIAAATQAVDGLLHRSPGGFRPILATKYFDWPNASRSASWRLWLGRDELISLTSITSGGVAIDTANVFLYPSNDGPPYDALEINLGSNSAWAGGTTSQRAIAAVGLWGHRNDEETVGTLAAELGNTEGAAATITWTTGDIGVGDVLRIGSERMIVTERSMVDSTQDLQASLAASVAATAVTVSNGAAFEVDQVLLVDAERMLVVDVAGNTLVVKRAWDGSVLAAHNSGASVYTLTGVTLDRAALGTTIATHATSTVVYRHVVPGLVRELATAEAVVALQQGSSGYADQVSTDLAQRDEAGPGLPDLRLAARRRFRRLRQGVV